MVYCNSHSNPGRSVCLLGSAHGTKVTHLALSVGASCVWTTSMSCMMHASESLENIACCGGLHLCQLIRWWSTKIDADPMSSVSTLSQVRPDYGTPQPVAMLQYIIKQLPEVYIPPLVLFASLSQSCPFVSPLMVLFGFSESSLTAAGDGAS